MAAKARTKLRSVPSEQWLEAAIAAGIRDGEEVRSDPGWFHPSSSANTCARFHQFAFVGVPGVNRVPHNVSLMGTEGTALHRHIQAAIKDHPRISGIEERLEDPVTRVRGSNDFKAIDYDDILAIADIKGCITLPEEPKPDHVPQLAWYCYLSGAARAIFLYVARGNCTWRTLRMPWSEMRPIWEQSRDLYASVRELTNEGTLAPRTPKNRTQCGECPFQKPCDDAQAGDRSWLAYQTSTLKLLEQEQTASLTS